MNIDKNQKTQIYKNKWIAAKIVCSLMIQQ
jgi:hypothetical protein